MWTQWLPIIVSTIVIPLMGWFVRNMVLDSVKELRDANIRQGERLGELEKFRAIMEDRIGRVRKMTDAHEMKEGR